MISTKWNLNTHQSDFMIRAKNSIIAYLDSSFNKLSSTIDIDNNQLINANIEFVLDVNKKEGKLEHIDSNLNLKDFIDSNQYPFVTFKSISFEKINNDINFVKGNLTINNITKVVELDTKIASLESNNDSSKVILEIIGEINRSDFGLYSNSNQQLNGLLIGSNINITANLEFETNN
ncbi:YceI family protein [Flavobacterium sp.]|uniref:YceI family protein n=1 Tax=Flavobacterium sp. TaxID=239 RepID=UPI002619B9B4|nr:YceI family protein [Flavobacterium sp.]